MNTALTFSAVVLANDIALLVVCAIFHSRLSKDVDDFIALFHSRFASVEVKAANDIAAVKADVANVETKVAAIIDPKP